MDFAGIWELLLYAIKSRNSVGNCCIRARFSNLKIWVVHVVHRDGHLKDLEKKSNRLFLHLFCVFLLFFYYLRLVFLEIGFYEHRLVSRDDDGLGVALAVRVVDS